MLCLAPQFGGLEDVAGHENSDMLLKEYPNHVRQCMRAAQIIIRRRQVLLEWVRWGITTLVAIASLVAAFKC
jgi:hypothetical protein